MHLYCQSHFKHKLDQEENFMFIALMADKFNKTRTITYTRTDQIARYQ